MKFHPLHIVFRLTVTLLLFLGLCTLDTPAQALEIDVSQNLGTAIRRGIGFHGGLTEDVPAQWIDPLNPRLIRRVVGDVNWQRAASDGTVVVQLLAEYQYERNWSAWDTHVRTLVQEAKTKKSQYPNLVYQYDIWNESDQDWAWAGTDQQFYDWWKQTYQLLRQLDPTATIVGPSGMEYGATWLRNFLTYAKSTNTLPDMIAWHELWPEPNPTTLEGNLANAKSVLSSFYATTPQIQINEIVGNGFHLYPASHVVQAAFIERNQLFGSALAYWSGEDGGSTPTRRQLNHLLNASLQPRSNYWATYRYAHMKGNVVNVKYDSSMDGIATVNNSEKKVQILVGKFGSASTQAITLKNLSSVAFLGTQVKVVGQRIAYSGKNAADEPTQTFTQSPTISNGTLSITLPSISQWDAYYLEVTPITGSSTPTPVPTSVPTPTPTPIPTVLPTPTPITETECMRTDINLDGQTNLTDYAIFVQNFLKLSSFNPRTDFNGDGSVNLADYVIFVRHFLKSCQSQATPTASPLSTPSPSPTATPTGGQRVFTTSNSKITVVEVQPANGSTIYLQAKIESGTPASIVAWYFGTTWKTEDKAAPFHLGSESGGYALPAGTTSQSIRVVVFASQDYSSYIEGTFTYTKP